MEAYVGVDGGLYSYSECEPDSLGFLTVTNYRENNELPAFFSDNVEERPPVSTHGRPKKCPEGCGITLTQA